ncbi:hypothetical protein K501DRAFT_276449 [Backusella circina FSU 941]|nr:hypothetical protein K501DRAFT_276449 [Backusella circina FSU 941]
MGNIRINSGEKSLLNNLKKHPDVQFPLEKILTPQDKIFIVIQCVLGDISLYASGIGLATESADIIKNATRTVKCLIDCAIYEQSPSKLKFSLQLYQSLLAKVWTNSALILKQIRGIGQQKAKVLAQSNVVNFKQIRECDPGRLEMILHRNPPFGTESLTRRGAQDQYDNLVLDIKICLDNKEVAFSKNKMGCYCQFWIETSYNELVDFRRILISKLFKNPQIFKLKIPVQSSDMEIHCHLQSENYVGIDIHETIKPKVDPRKYIAIAGATTVPIQNYSTVSNDKGHTHDNGDDLFDDDFDLEELNQLADSIMNETAVLTTSSQKEVPKTQLTKVASKRVSRAKAVKKSVVVEAKQKKQSKAKRARDTDTSPPLKTKRQKKKNVSKQNVSKNSEKINNTESKNNEEPKENEWKDEEPKNNDFKENESTNNKSMSNESTENEFKNDGCNQTKDENRVDLFGNRIPPRDKISDNDTIFTKDGDYYFENNGFDHCCDSLLSWLDKHVMIVSDSE